MRRAETARDGLRRLRDKRAVQVALDVYDLDEAITVATAAAKAGADLIEVGDPLIKHAGIAAIEQVKRAVPDSCVVAEMMSSDWGRDQVLMAAAAGADVVLLIGPASSASVSAAVSAGVRLGVPILLDVPSGKMDRAWVRAMERAGIDGFCLTTNIDLGVRGEHPLTAARHLRGWTRLPVAVSGGFSVADTAALSAPDWDIAIIGRGITEAIDPLDAARRLITLARTSLRSTP